MKNFKKVLVLALAVIMCLTVLSVSTFADTFNPTVSITARFNNEGNKIIASVVTSQPAGAIKGTLTYSGLTFDATSTKVAETEGENKYSANGSQIKFVLVADDVTKGDTHWADFYFEVPASGSVNFNLTDVAVCDIDENLSDSSIVLEGATLTLTEGDLRTLGAQYREENPALRFGTKLDVEKATNSLGDGKTAVRCGFLAGFEHKVGKGTQLTAEINEKGLIKTASITKGAINKQAKNCLSIANDHIIYTYAVTGFENAAPQEVEGVSTEVKDLPIVARPYVVYVDGDGAYHIDFGAQVSKSYAEIQAASGLLDETLGYK